MPQAQVVATNSGTSVEYKATTNAAGQYVLLNLPPGTYTVTAGGQGFKTTVRSDLVLIVNQSSTLDFVLEVGAVTQKVEVTGAPPTLQTGTATLGTLVDQGKVADLPLNGRNFSQLLLLVPGASPVDYHAGYDFVGNSILPAVGGQFSRSSFFMVDGIINYDAYYSGFAINPSLDSIQEFDVETHNDNAEAGGSLGGQINVITKSGTNTFHGSVYEFNRNKAVSARNFFDPATRPNFNQNQFGFSVGGPIPIGKLKHNTWFFTNYEGYRFTQGATNRAHVPTAAEWAGDFSESLGSQVGVDALGRPVFENQIFNPYTGRATTAGQVDPTTGLVAQATGFVREPFPGNVIDPTTLPSSHPGQYPAGEFNPLVAWQRWVPLPNLPLQDPADPFSVNYVNTQSATNVWNQHSIRVDHRFGDNDLVYGQWLRFGARQLMPGSVPNGASSNTSTRHIVGLHWVHNFGSTAGLDLRAAFQQVRMRVLIAQPSDKIQLFSDAGFAVPDASLTLGGGGNIPMFPNVGLPRYVSIDGSAGTGEDPNRVQQYAGDITKTMGRHTFKAGAQWFHIHETLISTSPSVAFKRDQTGDTQNRATTGNELASLLIGDVDTAAIYGGNAGTVAWFTEMGFYGQDSWRVTPKLTMNFGLRWDHSTPPSARNNWISGFDLSTGNYYLAGSKVPPACDANGNPYGCIPGGTLPPGVAMSGRNSLAEPVYDNFQPRLGLAYRLSDRTVVRAGGGWFFDNWANVIQGNQGVSTTGQWPFGANISQGNLNDPVFTVDTQHPFPPIRGVPPTFNHGSAQTINTKGKNPYIGAWNLDVQRQMTNSLTLTAAYVGSKGSRLYSGFIQNVAPTPGAGPVDPRRPYAKYGISGFLVGGRQIGSAWYNAFQFKLDQRLNYGLSYLVSYTWSKSTDTGCSGYAGIEGCEIQNPNNLPGEKSVSDFDIPHMLVISYTWALPFGKGKSYFRQGGLASAILGNWQVNGITSFYSGRPFTPNVSTDLPNTGNLGFYRPDQISDPTAGRDVKSLVWVNPNAFQFAPDCRIVPASECRFGYLGRNTLRDKAKQNWDFSFFRDFPISERLGRIQIRAELFNIFNLPNLAATSGNTQWVNLQSGNFGRLNFAGPGRQIQFGGKWIF
ncbi:MAG: carboxypeptidase-like regulatory domain-containing protein [Acidobacteriia bacterium]|nr:carboxypeptidase-like regulatory domain-containing protein [Terriglobia bacterium]